MIIKTIDENAISVIPEDSDDLLKLRRIIKQGDRVIGDTTRVLKREQDYSRPDKGERIKVKVSLSVEKISLDDVLDKLRVGGTIVESSNEAVPHGTHHSFIIKLNDGITISKKRWASFERRLLKAGDRQTNFVLIAIDTADAGIARLHGTHLEFMPNIYSGSGGKRYKTSFNVERFFDKVLLACSSICKKEDTVIVFGPGETKKRFVNYMRKEQGQNSIQNKTIIVEGIDTGGEDGIYVFTKSQMIQNIISDSKLAKAAAIIDEVMILAAKQSTKFTMGYKETAQANQIGAAESIVFSEKVIQDNDEQEIVDLLNDAESKGVTIYSVDSSTDIGLRVTGLGGIVALLRYANALS